MIRPYAAFNVLPTEMAESGRSRTKLLPAANAIADCLVLSVIANATVVWLEGERRTRSRIVLLCSPILRSTTTVSNFRVFTRRMALGTSVHTSVVAANSRSGSEICLIVNGSSETTSARTADSEEVRFMQTASLGTSSRYCFRRLTDTEQEQTLVILLHAVLLYTIHDQFPNPRQGLGGFLTQQLFQSRQTKLFVSLAGYLRDAIGEHQEHITR